MIVDMMKFEYFLVLMFVFISCREIVTDEFEEFTPVPVVNSIIISGEPIKVHVSLAQKLDSTRLTLIENAIVSLYIDGIFKETLSFTGDGIYISTISAVPSTKYSCIVDIPGYNEVICTDSIPHYL